ncbi:DM13 domain-containing protein [Paenarthrobacter nitroguajacolicus]|uniref:DM13 domain-containing protein n=1 Tax=Paenarthrobacter nitroguajacolicus TaxID=211146 RepID=A0A558H2C2_PAENT|nr:DM13 domain-containing protein [Paenarthrobacter nitroguajacolicus]TVU63262.1 DM13 domain-containing protein [Paenarthrobacter nitroguajacolicus]
MNTLRRLIRAHRTFAAVAGVAVLSLLVVGAALFQPWRLFTSSSVDEALPAAPVAGSVSAEVEATVVETPAASGPVVLGTGAFQSQEHETTGTARLLKLPDGSHLLRLENLASSDGPDVKVWLSSQEAGGDWFKYRSGRYVDLGAVKATHGNQNYVIPAGTDIAGLASVVLWCDRFSVAFGSAPLA